ncbi:ribonuclease HII [Anaerocolumna jejuensis]|uniref:ribonuclease HII n=1 Tax=Anaerocolumna jejuensis TaxID=259063 RepID=UPI003F7B9DDB
MIRLNILNMEDFLRAVNECAGAVNLLQPDGRKENINKQFGIQSELLQRYRENKNFLGLTLDIPVPKDYMNIVFYSIGDC